MDEIDLKRQLRATRVASRSLNNLAEDEVVAVLLTLADLVETDSQSLLEANRHDLSRMDPEDPKYDRLLLDTERLKAIADALRRVAGLESPVGKVLEHRTLENGLELEKVSVPMDQTKRT